MGSRKSNSNGTPAVNSREGGSTGSEECKHSESFLAALCDRELDTLGLDRSTLMTIGEHVGDCAVCAEKLTQMKEVSEQFKHVRLPATSKGLRARLWQRISVSLEDPLDAEEVVAAAVQRGTPDNGCFSGRSPTSDAVLVAAFKHGGNGLGRQVAFKAINEPGCYICNWSGHLLRVPDDALKPGRSPVIIMLGCDQLFVTRISNDPFVPVTKARMLAANCDVTVNF